MAEEVAGNADMTSPSREHITKLMERSMATLVAIGKQERHLDGLQTLNLMKRDLAINHIKEAQYRAVSVVEQEANAAIENVTSIVSKREEDLLKEFTTISARKVCLTEVREKVKNMILEGTGKPSEIKSLCKQLTALNTGTGHHFDIDSFGYLEYVPCTEVNVDLGYLRNLVVEPQDVVLGKCSLVIVGQPGELLISLKTRGQIKHIVKELQVVMVDSEGACSSLELMEENDVTLKLSVDVKVEGIFHINVKLYGVHVSGSPLALYAVANEMPKKSKRRTMLSIVQEHLNVDSPLCSDGTEDLVTPELIIESEYESRAAGEPATSPFQDKRRRSFGPRRRPSGGGDANSSSPSAVASVYKPPSPIIIEPKESLTPKVKEEPRSLNSPSERKSPVRSATLLFPDSTTGDSHVSCSAGLSSIKNEKFDKSQGNSRAGFKTDTFKSPKKEPLDVRPASPLSLEEEEDPWDAGRRSKGKPVSRSPNYSPHPAEIPLPTEPYPSEPDSTDYPECPIPIAEIPLPTEPYPSEPDSTGDPESPIPKHRGPQRTSSQENQGISQDYKNKCSTRREESDSKARTETKLHHTSTDASKLPEKDRKIPPSAKSKTAERPVAVESSMPTFSIITNFLNLNGGRDIPATLITKFGRRGSEGCSDLCFPIGLTTTQSKDIIACDTGNNLVKVFTFQGVFKMALGTVECGVGFKRPSSPAVDDSSGDIFIKDDRFIQVFSKQGKYKGRIGDGILGKPYGLKWTEDGHLVTLDQRNRNIFIFATDGKVIKSLPFVPLSGSRKSLFRFIAVYKDNLITVDLGQHEVVIVSLKDGHEVTRFGSAGHGPGQFIEPSGVTCDKHGNLLVADSKNNRIQIFSMQGDFRCQLKLSESIVRPSDIHLTDDGDLLVDCYLHSCIKIYRLG